MLNLLSYFFLFHFFIYTKSKTIYQCSGYWTTGGQCLNKWIDSYGNIRVDLVKCPVNKFCQTLTRAYDDSSIGICVNNFKRLYNGDKCASDAECSSFHCINNICDGINYMELCIPGRFQCKNNLVCRKHEEPYVRDEIWNVYRCKDLSKIYEGCESNNECELGLVCSNYVDIFETINDYYNNNRSSDFIFQNVTINETLSKNYNGSVKLENIKYYFSYKDYLKITEINRDHKICLNRSSLNIGIITWEEMTCKTGVTFNFEIYPGHTESICVSKIEMIEECNNVNKKCRVLMDLGPFGIEEVEEECIYSTKGNLFCPLNEKQDAWYQYLKYYDIFYQHNFIDKGRENGTFHIPVYKNTFNDLKLSEYFWRYKDWHHTLEADECTLSFFFMQSISKMTKINIGFIFFMIFLLLL